MHNDKPPSQVWLTHQPGQHKMERTGRNDPSAVRYVLWADHEELLEYAQRMTAKDESDPVSVLVQLRFAIGDNGSRTIPELLEFARGLAAQHSQGKEG